MTVEELIAKLKNFPQDLRVVTQTPDDWDEDVIDPSPEIRYLNKQNVIQPDLVWDKIHLEWVDRKPQEGEIEVVLV